jgi:hypothetical protein
MSLVYFLPTTNASQISVSSSLAGFMQRTMQNMLKFTALPPSDSISELIVTGLIFLPLYRLKVRPVGDI